MKSKNKIILTSIFFISLISVFALYFIYPANLSDYNPTDPTCDHGTSAKHPIFSFIKIDLENVCQLPDGWRINSQTSR